MGHIAIDTSMLPYGKGPKRIRDRAYLDSAVGRPCMVDPNHDEATVVGAHISCGHNSGMALKASDDLVLWLCYACHSEFDGANNAGALQGALWIVKHIVEPQRQRAYRLWLADKKRGH